MLTAFLSFETVFCLRLFAYLMRKRCRDSLETYYFTKDLLFYRTSCLPKKRKNHASLSLRFLFHQTFEQESAAEQFQRTRLNQRQGANYKTKAKTTSKSAARRVSKPPKNPFVTLPFSCEDSKTVGIDYKLSVGPFLTRLLSPVSSRHQWLGAPSCQRGSYAFYKSVSSRARLDGPVQVWKLGEFYFIRCGPQDPVCIAEVRLNGLSAVSSCAFLAEKCCSGCGGSRTRS